MELEQKITRNWLFHLICFFSERHKNIYLNDQLSGSFFFYLSLLFFFLFSFLVFFLSFFLFSFLIFWLDFFFSFLVFLQVLIFAYFDVVTSSNLSNGILQKRTSYQNYGFFEELRSPCSILCVPPPRG